MMTIRKTAFTLAALMLTVTVGSLAQANTDIYRHIDQLALKIERKARAFKSVIGRYRHTPEYEHLINDAVQMCRLAEHVHDVAHREGNLAHLESDLRQLDKTYHHIEKLVERIEHNAAFGAGHVHGNTRVVWTIMADLEECIHHIRDDLVQLRRAARVRRVVIPACGHAGCKTDCRLNRPTVDPRVRNYDGYGRGWNNGQATIDRRSCQNVDRFQGRSEYGYGYGSGYGNDYRVGRNIGFDTYDRGGITLGNGNLQFRIGF